MIKVKVTGELLTDLMTPGVITGPIECIKGLPLGATLKEVSLDPVGTILLIFNDGKEEETDGVITFNKMEIK